jgi:hypothetical protein
MRRILQASRCSLQDGLGAEIQKKKKLCYKKVSTSAENILSDENAFLAMICPWNYISLLLLVFVF